MSDSPLDIAVLLDDAELTRLVALWPKLSEKQRQDPEALAIGANLTRNRVHEILQRARMNNLIFDDGKVNAYAQKYLSTMIAARLSAKKTK